MLPKPASEWNCKHKSPFTDVMICDILPPYMHYPHDSYCRAGKRKRTISNRAMKRLKVADPTVLPSDEEVQSLHNLWWEYCLQMIGNCHSEAQLQARHVLVVLSVLCDVVGALL